MELSCWISQLKSNNDQKQNMTCNDYLTLQKTPLLHLGSQDTMHYLNPFGELLFTQKWKWSQLHLPHQKVKASNHHNIPSFQVVSQTDRVAFMLLTYSRFENLTANEKIAVTTINNSHFIDSFIKMLPLRNKGKLFNLHTEQSIDSMDAGEQDSFFDELISQLRVAYLSEQVVYIPNVEMMGLKMLNWFNKVTSSRVFQYATKAKKGEENPLWFSGHSYHYLENWLVDELEISIVGHFLDKNVPELIIPELQVHFKSLGRHQEASALAYSLADIRKKSKGEINNLKLRIREEEERWMEIRQQKLISKVEMVDKVKKKKRKVKARGNKKQEECIKQDVKIQSPKNKENQVVVIDKKIQVPKVQEKIQVKKPDKSKQKPKTGQNHQTKMTHHSSKQLDKESKQESNPSKSSKNYIRVSPKRRRSPQQLMREKILQPQIRQKYSEQDHGSYTVTESERLSEHVGSNDQFCMQERQTVKRRRKRNKKESERVSQLSEMLMDRLLNRQIDGLVDQLGNQTNALYNHKIIAFQRVRTFIQSLYPMTNAILFGSNAVGLSLPNSDVDILLTCINCQTRQIANQILAQIAVEINAMGWVVSCSTYLWAKVPLVKLQIDTFVPFVQTKRKQDLFRIYDPSVLYHLDHQTEQRVRATIKVDITLNIQGVSSQGYQSTMLMKDWMCRMPVVQKMVLVFKYILSTRGYNSNFTGGIGSYCLFVMIVAYLKTYPTEEVNAGKYFIKLLKWYGEEFDNFGEVITLKEEGTCFVCEGEVRGDKEEGKVGLLKIVDPITSRLMSSSCNEYTNIQIQFRRILSEFVSWKGQLQSELKIGVNPTQLLKICHTKKSIDKWLNKFQHKYQPSLKTVIDRT